MSFWDWKSACTIVQRVPASSLKKNRKKSVRKKKSGLLGNSSIHQQHVRLAGGWC
jgi:hypothetical protein